MNVQFYPFVVTFFLSFICVVADYLLKRASETDTPYYTFWFYTALTLEALTAFGWVYVMRHVKLATLGAIYSVSIALLLALLGVFVFNESLSFQEIIGIFLAIGSLAMLSRFI
jgi:drug/metabolite transporter (DMT)-like permease